MSTPATNTTSAASASKLSPRQAGVGPGQQPGMAESARGRAAQQPAMRTASRSASPVTRDGAANDDDQFNAEQNEQWEAAEKSVRRACELMENFNSLHLDGLQSEIPGILGQAFNAIKDARKSEQLALLNGQGSMLPARLANSLELALHKLARLCSPSRAGAASFDLAALGVEHVVQWCYALSVAVGNQGSGLLSPARLQGCKEAIRSLNAVMLKRASALGLPCEAHACGDVLAVLSWLSRGLKTRLPNKSGEHETLLQATPELRSVFQMGLLRMHGWRSARLSETGGERGLDSGNLGKALAQIGSALKLVDLKETAQLGQTWRDYLCELVLKLLQDGAALKCFTKWKFDASQRSSSLEVGALNGVTVANVANLVKDFIEAGLFDVHDARVQSMAGAVCRWIAQLSAGDLLKDSAQTLSNCANFLRTLCEPAFHQTDYALAESEDWARACKHLLTTLGQAGNRRGGPRLGPQPLANLASFVKAMGKLEASASKLPKPAPTSLRQCVQTLQLALPKLDQGSATAETLSSLVSALGFFACRNLGLRSDLLAWIEQFFKNLKPDQLKSGAWPAKSRELLMKTVFEMWDQDVGAANAALCLLPAWNNKQDKTAYLKAAQKLLRQEPERIETLQEDLKRLLGLRAGRKATLQDIEQALAGAAEEAPVAPLADASPEKSGPAEDQQTSSTVAQAKPLRLAQMQKPVNAANHIPLSSSTLNLDVVTSPSTSSTYTSYTGKTALAAQWSTVCSAPQLRVVVPSLQDLRAQATLSEKPVAADQGRESSDEDESARPVTKETISPPRRKAKKKKKKSSNMPVDDTPRDEAQLLLRLADIKRPGEAWMTPTAYGGKTESAVYWAIKLGRPDLVIIRLTVLNAGATDAEVFAGFTDLTRKILVDESEISIPQQRALIAALTILGQCLPQFPERLMKAIAPLLPTAAVGWQLSFVQAGMIKDAAVMLPPAQVPGSTAKHALFAAMEKGGAGNLRALMKKHRLAPSDVLKLTADGTRETALMCALQGGAAMVRACLELGSVEAQLEARNRLGQNALAKAVRYDKFEELEVMLSAAARVPQLLVRLMTPSAGSFHFLLSLAASRENTACLRLLLRVAREHKLLPGLLLQSGLSGNHPLHHACRAGNHEAVTLLLAEGAQSEQLDVSNDWGTEAFMVACAYGKDELVADLIERERKAGRLKLVMERSSLSNDNAFRVAAAKGSDSVLMRLLNIDGLEPRRLLEPGGGGLTLLMDVAGQCKAATMRGLLKKLRGAGLLEEALLQADALGRIALYHAVSHAEVNTIDALLESGFCLRQLATADHKNVNAEALARSMKREPVLQLLQLHMNSIAGGSEAQYTLGSMLVKGEGLECNTSRGVQLMQRAYLQNYPQACFHLGMLILDGLNGRDLPAFEHCMRQAGKLGLHKAWAVLGGAFMSGRRVPINRAEAVACYRRGAELNEPMAQLGLADCLNEGLGVPQDKAQALGWMTKAAAAGHVDAQFRLAMALMHGETQAVTAKSGFAWLEKAQANGHLTAKVQYARCLLDGALVEVDALKALSLLNEACQAGEPSAWYQKGFFYQYGLDGIAINANGAAACYLSGAEKGDPQAQASLADCYNEGFGLPADPAKYLHWLEQAAKGHYLPAMLELGSELCLSTDSADNARGMEWIRKAVATGDPGAREMLSVLELNLDDDDDDKYR